MPIIIAGEKDFGRLSKIWESAVLATHDFLSREHFEYIREHLRPDYLPGVDQILMAVDDEGRPRAFIGLVKAESGEPARVEMLFVEAQSQGRGYGRLLLEAAAEECGPLELEVNEQNSGARSFYEKMGFKVTGRFETDGQGWPYPLLRMRRG